MDAIELLTSQHDQIEALFIDCEEATGMQKQALFDQIADLLAVHAAIEEKHFYPAAKAAGVRERLDESVQQHFQMKQKLAKLIDMGVDAEGFDDELAGLRADVYEHVHDVEEPELFPRVRRHLDGDTLQAIAEQMTETMVTLESEGTPRNQVFEELEHPATL